MPALEINYLAVVIAIIAVFFLGFIWYTPLFGRAWAAEVGIDFDQKPAPNDMFKAMGLSLLADCFIVYVLAHILAVWSLQSPDATSVSMSICAAWFIWLGFMVPILLNTIAWEKKSWKLFAINSGYYFCALLLASFILTQL